MCALTAIEKFLRRHVLIVVIANIIVALFWIPAFIASFLRKPEPAPVQTPPPPPAQSPPASPPQPVSPPAPPPEEEQEKPLQEKEKVESEQVKEKEKPVVEKRLKRKEKTDTEKKKEEKKKEETKKEEKKEKEEKEEEKPPKGPFGFSCTADACYMFDTLTGKRYSKGDTIQGWHIKDISIHGAVLIKKGKEVRIGVE